MKKLVRESLSNNRFFKIVELDQDGRYVIDVLGIFSAANEKEARRLAAEKFNNEEIASTGFYEAREVTQSEIDEEIAYLQSRIDMLKSIKK